MADEIKQLEHRVVIAKGLLQILRTYATRPDGVVRFGSRTDELILSMAVFIGQAEGRLMGPSKLAEFCGMARPSVIRKLTELERDGVLQRVNGDYIVRLEVANSDRALALNASVVQQFFDIVRKLSKLDMVPIVSAILLNYAQFIDLPVY